MQPRINQIEIREKPPLTLRPALLRCNYVCLEKEPAFYDIEPNYQRLLGVSNLPREQRGKTVRKGRVKKCSVC